MKKTRNELGFTLIEMLVVLSIIGVLLLFIVPLSTSFLENNTEEKVLEMFQYDLLYLQNQSLGVAGMAQISLFKDCYYIVIPGKNDIVRYLPNGWEIDFRNRQSISFNRYGTIREPGTIQIISPKNKYNVIFPLGKGRGYIEKQ